MNHPATITPVHSGNYYTIGVRRVLSKLAEMGIVVPPAALSVPQPPPHNNGMEDETLVDGFTQIEHAMLDWFEDRDYDQAQALVSSRHNTTCREWHVIEVLDEDRCPADISSGMLCPSLRDAVGAVIDASDRDVVRLDACRKDGTNIIVVIGGSDAARIQPVRLEPFDLAVRDRVRTAFKGVREFDVPLVLSRAARLPGFNKVIEPNEDAPERAVSGCMLLGFPGNWAFAMRNALKQVDIVVTQSQAQELCAVFFGAGTWHQLVKHQNEPDNTVSPVAAGFEDENGVWQRRFYHTPEEAVFATGLIVKLLNATTAVTLNHVSLSLDRKRVYWGFAKKAEMDALSPMDRHLCRNWIESGCNDYWDMATYGSEGINIAVQELLGRLDAGDGSTSAAGVIYPGASDREMLEGLLGRNGIPPEQIVYMGDCALAVSYVDDPDGRENMRAANLQVFKFTESGPHKLKGGNIAMYKAVVRVVKKPGCTYLVIRGDYGNHDPIEIPINDWTRVERLAWLTHREGLSVLEPFDFGDDKPHGMGKLH